MSDLFKKLQKKCSKTINNNISKMYFMMILISTQTRYDNNFHGVCMIKFHAKMSYVI